MRSVCTLKTTMGFCPRCGTETEHQFCNACLRELHPLIKKIGHIGMTMCPSCLRVMDKGIWSNKKMQDVVERTAERAISYNQGVRIDGVVLEELECAPGEQDLQLNVIGSADAEGESYEEYYEAKVYVQGNRCTDCDHQANTYFTGILQLRRPNDVVQTEIERQLGKALTDAKDVTGGIDYYVTSHHILQNIVRAVHTQFGGELTIRAQHFSYDAQASKNLYRVNACLRLPKFWKGSLVRTGIKLMRITNMGKVLKGVDIETGKAFSAPCKNEYPEFPLIKTTVVTTRPQLTVLDPETYQTVTVKNGSRAEFKELEAGAEITVAYVDDMLYIVNHEKN